MPSSIPGNTERPLRVAVVGAGPAGFYAAEALLKRPSLAVEIDLIERLPAPFGLLRYGVAPDHPKIKSIAVAYERIAADPRVRFLGNVGVRVQGDGESGALTIEDLLAHYDQVVVTTGCETDRRLGIPGEDLEGSLAATRFVAWYNGHPDHVDLDVKLNMDRVVVVGIGDVALDLARILLRNPEELATTDITDAALQALRGSRVREVVLLARRGPAQTAFAAKEFEDVLELDGVEVCTDVELVRGDLEHADPHAGTERHLLEVLSRSSASPPKPSARRLILRFLTSPVEVVGEDGRVIGVRVEKNELITDEDGKTSARGSGCYETLSAGLVLRSVGYRGVALEGMPFDEGKGVVPSREGRVVRGDEIYPRLYVAGWIKRGATGVVGTNKADAAATVTRMLEDLPTLPEKDAEGVGRAKIDELLRSRKVDVISWEDWTRIDARERERGAATAKVREKFTTTAAALAAARQQ